jgi:hypothetical protein
LDSHRLTAALDLERLAEASLKVIKADLVKRHRNGPCFVYFPRLNHFFIAPACRQSEMFPSATSLVLLLCLVLLKIEPDQERDGQKNEARQPQKKIVISSPF